MSRKHIIDALNAVGSEYRSYASAALKGLLRLLLKFLLNLRSVMSEAQIILRETFGLDLLDGKQIPGVEPETADAAKYFIVNNLK